MAKKTSKKKVKSSNSKETRLKKIGVLSLAKIAGLFGIIYGLVAGILMAVVISQAGMEGISQQFGTITNFGSAVIVILPILYGALYFIAGIVTAFIYNVLASRIGGVKLQLE